MKCQKCNKIFQDGTDFCPYCGAPVNQEASKSSKLLYTAKRSIWYYSKKIWVGIAVLALVVFLTVVLAVENLITGIVWAILLVGLLIGILSFVLAIIGAAHYSLEIYTDKVVERDGLFNMHEKQSVFTAIIGVSISQTLWGKLFNYGSIHVDKLGNTKWDISMTYIKNPNELKKFFDTVISQTNYDKVSMHISD